MNKLEKLVLGLAVVASSAVFSSSSNTNGFSLDSFRRSETSVEEGVFGLPVQTELGADVKLIGKGKLVDSEGKKINPKEATKGILGELAKEVFKEEKEETEKKGFFKKAKDAVVGGVKSVGSMVNPYAIEVTPRMAVKSEYENYGTFGVEVKAPLSLSKSDNAISKGLEEAGKKGAFASDKKTLEKAGKRFAGHKRKFTLGNIELSGNWSKEFDVNAGMLNSVLTFAKLGIALPNGKAREWSNLLDVSTGTEDKFSLPASAGVTAFVGENGRIGFGLKGRYVFARNQKIESALKADEKVEVKHKPGYSAGLMAMAGYEFLGGALDVSAGYEFGYNSADKFKAVKEDDKFEESLVAKNVKSSTSHNLKGQLAVDFNRIEKFEDSAFALPRLSLSVAADVAGKNTELKPSVGLGAVFNF